MYLFIWDRVGLNISLLALPSLFTRLQFSQSFSNIMTKVILAKGVPLI